jgi:glyoxylase-like metal-dependent hydrolase (beta-lactamase superfamily II)
MVDNVRGGDGAPVVHRFESQAMPVNAYLVETEGSVVLVDSCLTVSDAKALRSRLDGLAKPLGAVLVTHAHPDHYGGLTDVLAGSEVPIMATAGVTHVIRRDDAEKEVILRPMFGDEWARERTFPNHTVNDGETVAIDGAQFRVVDLGPGESPHDSVWVLEGAEPRVFIGDVVYNHMHGYLADGHYEAWLANLERLKGMFAPDTVFYPGHGAPTTPALLDWQAGYIRTFVDAVRAAAATGADPDAATQQVTARMQEYLPGDDLLFLMQLSIPAVRSGLDASSQR